MSSEDDIFLKTFNQMIEVLNSLHVTIKSLRKTTEVIQLSIDGLGTGLTDVNTNISELCKKFDSISTTLQSTTAPSPIKVEKKPVKASKTPAKKAVASQVEPVAISSSTDVSNPIFIDLVKKINEAETYKEVGELLVESLDQIESTFSFSRVFYEIRRIGNSLIRKGEKEFPANDKIEQIEKIVDWEQRLVE
ncbi:MAG: hypothetical protein ACTSQB_06715 [Candidatus Heimdallarchaeota archaeon]